MATSLYLCICAPLINVYACLYCESFFPEINQYSRICCAALLTPSVVGVKDVHAFAAEIHPAVANNLSAVSEPGAIVVACFPAVADAQVFCCCWRSYSGGAVYPTVADVLAVVGTPSEAGVSMVHSVPNVADAPALADFPAAVGFPAVSSISVVAGVLAVARPPLHGITCFLRHSPRCKHLLYTVQ